MKKANNFQKVKVHPLGVYQNSWALDVRFGRWTVDAGLWKLDPRLWALDARRRTLDSRRWTLDAELWTLDLGLWMLDAGFWTLDVKTLKFKTIQTFENNEAISITLFFQATLSNHLRQKQRFLDDVERERRLGYLRKQLTISLMVSDFSNWS